MDNIKDLFELFRSKSQAGKDFEDKHVVHTKDDVNGNGDEVFKGSKVKPVDRKKTRLGHDAEDSQKVHEDADLDESYTIKSMGHENVHLMYKGKLVKKFSDPREAKMYLSKMQKQKVEEEVELSERNKENKLKKDIFTVKKGQAEVAKGINFARYQPTRIADLKGDDHRIVHPDDDEEFTKYAGRKTALRTYKLAGRNAMKNEALTEDDIIDAITEMAEIEGIELTEQVFNELYEALTAELNESKPTSVRESFMKKYVEPELIPHEQRIQEELSYLPESQLNLLLNLYEDLDEQNKAIFRKNLNDPDMINNFVDFALTNGDAE